jgi:GT2 family glycosyltransferase
MISLAVVTVVRNGMPGIARCLESIDLPGVRQVVVDGGSTDGTVTAIRSRSARLAWWCSEPDRGISDAFNKGIKHADASVIGILNADDWYEPHALAAVRRAFSESDAEVVHGRVRYWQDGVPLRTADGNHRALRHSGSVNHPSVFVRQEVYQRLGGFDLSYRYAMDYELMLRWLVAGVRFRYLPMILANMSLGGISDTQRLQALREVRRAQRLHLGRTVADAQHILLVGRYRLRQACERLGFKSLVALQRQFNRGMRSIKASS